MCPCGRTAARASKSACGRFLGFNVQAYISQVFHFFLLFLLKGQKTSSNLFFAVQSSVGAAANDFFELGKDDSKNHPQHFHEFFSFLCTKKFRMKILSKRNRDKYYFF